MRIPQFITILGREVEVIQLGSREMAKKFCPETLGVCSFDEQKIYLKRNLSREEKYQTLAHECIHLTLAITGANQKLSDGLEEVLCESVSNGLIDLQKSLGQYRI